MSFLFSQALVAEYLPEKYSDGKQLVPWKLKNIPLGYCSPGKTITRSLLSRFGRTLEVSLNVTTDAGHSSDNCSESAIHLLFPEVSHARIYPWLAKVRESMESEAASGKSISGLLKKLDLLSSTSKTAQYSLSADYISSLTTLPKWGMMRHGVYWALPMLELTISGRESGSLHIPTPTASDASAGSVISSRDEYRQTSSGSLRKYSASGKNGSLTLGRYVQLMWPTPRKSDQAAGRPTEMTKTGHFVRVNKARTKQYGASLSDVVKMWPTPTAAMSNHYPEFYPRNTPSLATQIGGKLNPTWVEWLMGWPTEWSALKPLETDKYHFARLPLLNC